MHLESGCGKRCAKHPSRTFTGFCPVCLSERLARVDKADKVVPKRSSYGLPGDDAGDNLSPPGGDDGSPAKQHQPPPPPPVVKVRKTLALLFQMNDDEDKKSNLDAQVTVPVPASSNHLGDFLFGEIDRGIGNQTDNTRDSVFSCENGAASVGGNYCCPDDHGSCLTSESRVDHDTKASSTSCSTTLGNSSSETYRASKTGSTRDESSMSRGSSSSASYWLGSALARTSAKWNITGVLRRCSSVHERGQRDSPCSRREKQSESNSSTRRSSCDWNLCSGSRKNSCEDPRHSWDSSVMGRAFMCSLTCFDEKENVNPVEKRNSDFNQSDCPTSQRENERVLDEAVVANPRPLAGPAAASRNHASTVEKEAKVMKGKPLKDMFMEDSHHSTIIPSVSKRISNRWSKVWNWSISSPFTDFPTRQGHGLDRSLSESWRERHQGKMESDNCSHIAGSSRAAHPPNRSRYSGSADPQNTRLEWPRNSKRDYRFRRSRSVHYSSPGNLDNGLLRFYLTPLRSINRNPTRGRPKTSRSFTRGIFGLS